MINAAREDDPTFDIKSSVSLARVANECNNDDVAFYAILARRFLGLWYDSQKLHKESVKQYEIALGEARRLHLDTEIGHLRRLLGWALKVTDDFTASQHHLEQALAYERLGPLFAYTAYWQAVSARELGDTIMRAAGRVVSMPGAQPGVTGLHFEEPEKLRPALRAYHDARMMLSSHLSVQSPFPIARAAKQQLFRSYATNAVKTACVLRATKDMLAEVEMDGPRQVTEIVTEIEAARLNPQTSLVDFRRDRAAYFRTLNTVPTTFEDYLHGLETHNEDRRRYLRVSISLDKALMKSHLPDAIAEQVMSLRLPDTILLLFHVETNASTMVVMDLSSGVAAPFIAPFGEEIFRGINHEYNKSLKSGSETESALDTLLARYQELFAPLLEPIARFLPGRRVKIFPRLQMNAVPFHALRINGKFLIEQCSAVSYGQTLKLFLENHMERVAVQNFSLRIVAGENVPFYEPLLPKVAKIYGDAALEDRPRSWLELRGSIAKQPARDTLFACHGQFDGDHIDESFLELSRNTPDAKIRFSQLFEELDLRDCRSVIMGVCESGLARTGVNSEYIGLPSAMLSSGARYVVGALWEIPQLATAVIIIRFLTRLKDPAAGFCELLCQFQREVMAMTRQELTTWFKENFPSDPGLPSVLEQIASWGEQPFLHPYHWAGLYALGDL